MANVQVVHSLADLKKALAGARPVFVPTMGALHAGHVALIRRAADAAAPRSPVVASVFVNPTQFGPNEDFTRYPRMLDADVKASAAAGAQIVFAPDVPTMYPPNEEMTVPPLPSVATQPKLEDAQRPTHFAGVCQVVARLFDLLNPIAAVFGEKDYQQLLVIQEMVQLQADRWKHLRIIAHPTVREADGLAMSSRNMYLKADERDRALGLWRALNAAKSASAPTQAESLMRETLENHKLQIDYAVVRDAKTLMPIASLDRPARGLIAARLGNVRLIDNLQMQIPGTPALGTR